MTTFLLIRHGETEAIGKLLTGRQPGWRLNQRGRQQAANLAENLANVPLAAIYTSPLERAVETAEIFARPHGLTPEPAEGLIDIDLGGWDGMTFANLEACPGWKSFNSFRSVARPPGGELAIESQSRIVREVERLGTLHHGKTVALVSHGDPLRLLIAWALGIATDLLLRFDIGTGSVSILQSGEREPRVRCINCSPAAALELSL
jgi:broad specificity phosphatase PhoE